MIGATIDSVRRKHGGLPGRTSEEHDARIKCPDEGNQSLCAWSGFQWSAKIVPVMPISSVMMNAPKQDPR